MKVVLPSRAMFGFLFGALALVISFVVAISIAVLRTETSHGVLAEDDYRVALLAIGLLTIGFGAGVSLLAAQDGTRIPLRIAAIAGAGSMTLLLVTMMLIGESLGFRGASVVAVASGLASSWLVCRQAMRPHPTSI